MAYDGLLAETITIGGAGGDDVETYFARPLGPGPYGGVVVIHHLPGYDEATKEITRRLAAHGYPALCPNLHFREAPGARPDDAAAAVRAAGGVPDDRLVGDIAGAARHLRALPYGNGKVGVIGFCSGGRQAVLAACSLPLDAAVDCYGAYVVGDPPAESPLRMRSIADRLDQLSAPLLGLFGADDAHPSPTETADLAHRLRAAGKTFDFHTYEGAGHAFFAVDRPSYRPAAAVDGWRRVLGWFDRHLS